MEHTKTPNLSVHLLVGDCTECFIVTYWTDFRAASSGVLYFIKAALTESVTTAYIKLSISAWEMTDLIHTHIFKPIVHALHKLEFIPYCVPEDSPLSTFNDISIAMFDQFPRSQPAFCILCGKIPG